MKKNVAIKKLTATNAKTMAITILRFLRTSLKTGLSNQIIIVRQGPI